MRINSRLERLEKAMTPPAPLRVVIVNHDGRYDDVPPDERVARHIADHPEDTGAYRFVVIDLVG